LNDDALPLFAWQPPACTLMAFPLHRRIGKVRDVASKLLAKTTARHADSYREQVTSALTAQMDRVGVPETQQAGQLVAFWRAVDCEVARLAYTRKELA
jgi:hypothetical protein